MDRDEGCVHAADKWEPPLPRVARVNNATCRDLGYRPRSSSLEGVRESVPVARGEEEVQSSQ